MTKPGHRQRNFKLAGLEDESVRFEVYQRQNESDETNRFTTLDGAFGYLIHDLGLEGVTPPEPDQPKLPYGS